MKLTKENIEEQILLLVDGELEEEATAAVLAYIEQHTEYQPMLDAYRATQLQPEEHIFFPGKESLLREEPMVLPLQPAPRPVLRWVAAAAILIIIGTATALLLQRSGDKGGGPTLAVNEAGVKSPASVKPGTRSADTLTAKTTTKNVLADNKVVSPAIHRQKTRVVPQEPVVAVVPLPQREKESVTPLATASASEMGIASGPVTATALDKRELVALSQEKEPASSWSPIKEETKQGVGELVTQIRTIKEEVKEKAQLLKGATIVFRFGDKEIALNK